MGVSRRATSSTTRLFDRRRSRCPKSQSPPKPPKAQKLPLLLVDWIDSRSPCNNWQWHGEGDYVEAPLCRTVGYEVKRTKESLHLAQSLGDVQDEDDFQVNGIMTIALRQVTKITKLKATTRGKT